MIDEEAAEPAAAPYAWYGLGVLVVVYMLNFVDRNILSILAEDIKRDLGLGDDQLGFLYGTAFGVFYALFGIPLGRLADRWHRVRLLTAGLSLWSLMTALSGLASSFASLSAARIGVGVGEASAGPAAYSLIADWFPKRLRATALAIYSSGLFIGAGVSLLAGGAIAKAWNKAYPLDAPLGLAGWQVAFMAVGLPGLLLALKVVALREPVRGAIDGLDVPVDPHPFRAFGRELLAIVPPLTLIGAARRGPAALLANIGCAAGYAVLAASLGWATGGFAQWIAVGAGCYAVHSWAANLRIADPVAFALIWRSVPFQATIFGYGTVAFVAYALSFWASPFAMRVLGQDAADVALWIGAPGAVAGFLGVIGGGRAADSLRRRHPAGRLLVILFGVVAPIPPLLIAYGGAGPTAFYTLNFVMVLCASSALGAAAATSQDLVLPRMKGTAAATFFVATTLFALALGPYSVGLISRLSGSLTAGVLALTAMGPVGLLLVVLAMRTVPAAEAGLVARARAIGEPV